MKKSKLLVYLAVMVAVALFAGAGLVFASDVLKASPATFKFFVNGKNVTLSEQPVTIDGKTYLPVRAFGDVMGKRVGWDEKTRTVIIDELLADGVYKAAEPEFNEHGWKAMVELTVKNGKIAGVKYEEVHTDGYYKTTSEEYLKLYTEMTQGGDFLNCIKTFENALIDTQSADMVDVVSGATYATYSFKALVKEALEAGPAE